MRVSVIVSAYNNVAGLRKCLLGLLAQSCRPDQLIVSDDGSTREVADLLRAPELAALPLEHVWQADDGWRRPRVLNLSLARCTGDYVVFIDGDCVPRADFVASHLRHARPRTFVSGGVIDVPRAVHPHFTDADVLGNDIFSPAFLAERWPAATRQRWRLQPGRWEAALNLLSYRYCALRGSNFSAWRSDILAVNGFDEEFAYGSDDREFGARLHNAGVSGRWLKFSLVALHLGHSRGGIDPVRARRQRRQFRQLFLTGRSWVATGIDTAVARSLAGPVPARHVILADERQTLRRESERVRRAKADILRGGRSAREVA